MSDDLIPVAELEILGEKIPFFTDPFKLKLFAIFHKRLPYMVVKTQISKFVEEKFPGVRIDEVFLKEIVSVPSNKPRRFGLAKPPTDSVDEKLILMAKPFSFSGSLKFLDNIEPGREVARIIPPKRGEDGYDIFGNSLRCTEPKLLNISIGDNISVEQQEKHKSLVSKTFGYLHYDGRVIDIREELVIDGDVSQATGHIRFVNRVKVRGNVGVGFIVKADNGIIVEGDVLKYSELFSSKGSISIKGNVDQAKLSAQGSIELFSAVRTQISGTSVNINKEALLCDIESTELVCCKFLIGGRAVSSKLIKIETAGNDAGIETILEIVSDTKAASEIQRINSKILALEKIENLLKMQLGPYQFKKPIDVPKQLQEKIFDLRNKLEQVQQAKNLLIVECKKFNQAYTTLTGEIQIINVAFPQVIFKIGDEKLILNEVKKGPFVVKLEKDKIKSE